MQYSYALTPAVRIAIEKTLSPQRFSSYLPAADGDPNLAFHLYLWNVRLCEAFYLPCHFCEVSLRNGLHDALMNRYAREDWHVDHRFLSTLPARLKAELKSVSGRTQHDHGGNATIHHVISGLSLGFWTNLLAKPYRNLLWGRGVEATFPLAPPSETQQTVHARLERFRVWRNRIFHHNTIFDKGPIAEFQNIETIVGWRCRDTQLLMRDEATVSRTVNSRPKV